MRVLFLVCVCVCVCVLWSSVSAQNANCSTMGVRLRAFRVMSSCNFTVLKQKHYASLQAPAVSLVLPVLYLCALVLGLPSNLVVLWVLLFRTKRVPSTALLINLTVADVLLLLVLPFRIVYHFKGNNWLLGEPFCRVVMALFYGNMYGSVLCLAFVALDRYIALVHPFGAKTLRSRKTSLYMTAVVWLSVIAAMLPLLMTRQTYHLDDLSITTCHDALPQEVQQTYFLPYFLVLFTVSFMLPFLVVLFCHVAVLRTLLAEGKRYGHAIRVTVLVLIVFIVCFLPSNILLLLTYADSSLDDSEDGTGEDLYMPYMVSLAVSSFNSCIDPFIYYFVSAEFREKVVGGVGGACCRGDGDGDDRPVMSYSSSSSSGQRSKVTLLSQTKTSQ